MKILVAGKGFIGSKIVEGLEQEHTVKTLDRRDADYEIDITKDFEIEEHFDVVFHTIGLAPGMESRLKYEDVHVDGTRNLIEAVDTDKIVYLSALGVGKVEHSFFQTKKIAEDVIKDSNMGYTIVRPSTVYGEGNKLLEMIRKTAPLRIFPDIKTKTQPIHITDLKEILVRSVSEFENRTLELGGPEQMTVGEMARKLYAEEGSSCILIPVSSFLQEAGLKLVPLSGPFSSENISLLRQQNTVEENDAEKILQNLRSI